MKIKIVPAIIALALSALFAYGLYSWGNNAEHNTLVSIIGGVSLVLTLGTVLGVSLDDTRKSVNIKVISSIFAIIAIIASIVFNNSASSKELIIIISSVIVLLWALLVYFIGIAKK